MAAADDNGQPLAPLLRKLIDKPFATPLLHTVPGVGVRLCAPATA